MWKCIIGMLIILTTASTAAKVTYHDYNGIGFKKVKTKKGSIFYSTDGSVVIKEAWNYKLNIGQKMIDIVEIAKHRNTIGNPLNAKMVYVCSFDHFDCSADTIPTVIPEYIAPPVPIENKKHGIDKVVMKFENFIKDNGNLYLQKQITDTTTLQYKSEYGDEYVGLKYVKTVDLNCKIFKLCSK